MCKKAAKLTRELVPAADYAPVIRAMSTLYPRCNWLQKELDATATKELVNGVQATKLS